MEEQKKNPAQGLSESEQVQVSQLLAAHLHLLALRQALSGVSLLFFHGFLPFRLSLRRG